ncbi:MAG: threonylcarbamoyl-AMP synthase [Clostridia bacterium]|nr:threonylcarbamoyl-AMP synthase [Clostridia bacterium]
MKTLQLSGDRDNDILSAAEVLKKGGLCAIPTETVYGLAADAYNGEAVKKIFEAKGRPQDNPLIVHIADLSTLFELWDFVPEQALRLAQEFWPGPLTMVMKKTAAVPYEVSCGLDTVGVRFPEHPVARRVIELAGVPLAAPSANLSGKPSPTLASHVAEDMQGRIDAILDGGACSVGVESTVVDMTGEVPRVLRPGAVTEEMISEVLGDACTDPAVEGGLKEGQQVRSPGMKYRHYAPESPVSLFCGAPDDTAREILTLPASAVICFDEYKAEFEALGFDCVSIGSSWDHAAHARRIFDALRVSDGGKKIYIQCPRRVGMGAASVNRLMRASGFDSTLCSPYPVIGVTGRSGSGKSYLSRKLGEMLGLAVFDSDMEYKKMLRENGELTKAILKAFPEADAEGRVDRRALGNIVFRDGRKKALLESITHPLVAKAAGEFARARGGAVLDVPLLFESGIDRMCTATLGVYAGEELIFDRICARDCISAEAAKLRLDAQPELKFYFDRCDLMVKNDGDDLNALRKIAEKLIKI